MQKLPREVENIYKKLKKNDFKMYLVGGAVRDIILGKPITDWDFATDATPDQIVELFPNAFYDNSFGTVGIPFEQNEKQEIIEVTTFRSESEYKDNRHPEKIEWGKTIEEDLKRRDFTINAIAIELGEFAEKVIDPYDGKKDSDLKVIRAVGDPSARFKEDALRILRAIRFEAQLGFKIDDQTWQALIETKSLISSISWERIRDELLKILVTERAYEGIKRLDEAGILEIILPELIKGKGVSQVRPGRHHTEDVFTHNLLSLKYTPSTDPVVKLATLIHDVGKPDVASKDKDGFVIFYNHEVRGAQLAYEIAERLRLSKKQREKIVTLIRWHMFTVDENATDSAVRRFIRKVGLENVNDMIDLRIGDRLGSGTKEAESWRLKNFKERIVSELNPPFSINDMAIDGNDIMKELKIKPGPKVGEILKKLFEEVDEDLSKNTRDYLLSRLKELNK